MISLTIGDMNKMTRQDADALRAIANVYHPINRNDNMDVGTLREAVGRGQPGALSTLAELNDAARAKVPTATTIAADYGKGPNTEAVISGTITASNIGTLIEGGRDIGAAARAPGLGEAFLASVAGTAARTGAVATERIAPEDNPAAGAPDQHALADQVFSGGVASLTSGNVADSLARDIAAMPDNPDSLAAVAQAAGWSSAPDPAQVFIGGGLQQAVAQLGAAINNGIAVTLTPAGGTHLMLDVDQAAPAPNVHAATPTPPPLPVATPQTSQQQSTAEPSASPPPPPPPAPLPADASGAAPSTSPAPAPTVDLDTAGLPWDGRIHASTKAKIANGTWKKRRGVEESEVAQVEAQLRATMAVPAASTPPNPWPFPTDSSSVGGTAEPAPTFPVLMAFITARVGDKRLTQEQVTAAVQATGLESLNLVMARPDLVPAIMDELKKVAP
jgi:hypothetical protein